MGGSVSDQFQGRINQFPRRECDKPRNTSSTIIILLSRCLNNMPKRNENRSSIYYYYYCCYCCCDSSVGIVLCYKLDDQGSRVLFPAGAGNFSLHRRGQNGSEAHPESYPMSTTGSFLGGKAAGV
jgi:hypothetical protein